MATVGWKDWLYLAASVVASYVLIQKERGESTSDMEIKVYWHAAKMARAVRTSAAEVEKHLLARCDEILDRGRTV